MKLPTRSGCRGHRVSGSLRTTVGQARGASAQYMPMLEAPCVGRVVNGGPRAVALGFEAAADIRLAEIVGHSVLPESRTEHVIPASYGFQQTRLTVRLDRLP